MASWFETVFTADAAPLLRDFLYTSATYYAYTANTNTQISGSVNVIWNEQVFAIDDRQRTLITVVVADLTALGIADAKRGDYLILSGDTRKWTVIDTRVDEAGMVELRCDAKMKEL